MLTKNYIKQVRDLTGFSDYKIAKEYNINQSNLSKYSSGKMAFSETHSFLFAEILGINPTIVMINTKIENAIINNNTQKLNFWQNQLEKLKIVQEEAKITIAQFNPIVGDIKGNTANIIKLIYSAIQDKSDLIIFPELAICGYPPEDLITHNGFIESMYAAITEISNSAININVVIGAVHRNKEGTYNSAFLLKNGKILGIYNKKNLPNYGVFDEKRYFSQGVDNLIFNIKGQIFSVIICEDTWSQNIIDINKNMGIDTIISINASPFCTQKHKQRIEIIGKYTNGINLIYVNMVGAQDGIIFDGGSFKMNKNGKITHQLPFFKELIHHLSEDIYHPYEETPLIYQSLVVGLKDYIKKNNTFQGAIVSFSGGIDSALVLAIAVDALGKENVSAIMMPYFYTSEQSLTDARDQVKNMDISYKEIDIKDIVSAFNQKLSINGIAFENIQARTRGSIAMAIANQENKILLATGNKSEMAVGYATLYGDMAGGYAPIKDVYKTKVYELAEYRNSLDLIIPKNTLEKEPSAELAPNQIDANTLPPYNILDKILYLFIEKSLSIGEIIAYGFEEELVVKVINMVKNSEYKRKQSTIGTKITSNSFDKDRRYPITNKYDFY